MPGKEALRAKFAADPKQYYEVKLFRERGFERRQCPSCRRHFWTLNPEQRTCQDQPCSTYGFLGAPATPRPYSYAEAWRAIEAFFVQRGHTSIKRYPVVCRWRPDLFFTVASIIDFQRVEAGKVVFELPHNPLIVPQLCLRFNDLPSVGVSGKLFSGFCMVGQHAIADTQGYWKDRCIELDFELVTRQFGIAPEEISFAEDVWLGYGAFGYTLEYLVRGLELGNAVFTAFEGSPESYREMEPKVVDMGAGLDRFAWISQGTPTAYDAVLGPVVSRLLEACPADYDRDFYLRYARHAGILNLDEITDFAAARRGIAEQLRVEPPELERRVAPLEAVYTLAEHTRSLLFAVSDGMLPSNVGGGYNLRVVLRRVLALLDRYGWRIDLGEVLRWHAEFLRGIYPEFQETVDDVIRVVRVETDRYATTGARAAKLVEELRRSRKPLDEEALITLYDSEGVTPDQLRDAGLDIAIPSDFYAKVTGRHVTQRQEEAAPEFDIRGLPATRLLYYEAPEQYEFDAQVLQVFPGKWVALDQTGFYPRGGGQEPDHGTLNGVRVVDVEKYGPVVLHRLDEDHLAPGKRVHGIVEARRRERIMRHHTATHIVNGASRRVLGTWVWQHSAFKEEDYGRLDITHFAALTPEEVHQIERVANTVVRENLPVGLEILPRTLAEERYGFRLYQGGYIPSRELRIIKIGDFDIEACAGTHNRSSGEIGLIKIVRSERVQDGVMRLEFVAGEAALEWAQQQEAQMKAIAQQLAAQPERVVEAVANVAAELETLKRRQKALLRQLASIASRQIPAQAQQIPPVSLYVTVDAEFDDAYHIALGEEAVSHAPTLIYCAFVKQDSKVRVLTFAGAEAQRHGVRADAVAREAAKLVGGGGGGTPTFAQGGGTDVSGLVDAASRLKDFVARVVRK